MNIGRRIYFDKKTGDILVDTGERSGDVIELTVEQDIANYKALSERNRDTFDLIDLKYGEYSQYFSECTGYRVNTKFKEFEFSYPDPNETEPAEPVYRKPLSEEVELLKSADLDNKEAITTLYEMILSGMER